ncbi:MAG: AAA domain-containing protein, partial [Armatimonadetes bacterium]|nr:AAA domain-containing protein [Armatimonadota bacterium]
MGCDIGMALNANAEARDKAKRLYQFIRGLIELRRVPVRSYRNYELVVPLDDLPDAPHCRFAARGDFAEEEETWLEVQCPKIEPYPEPPGILLEWLSPSELGDASLDMPNLLRGETVRSEDESSEDFVEADNAGLPSSAPEPPQEIKEAWENYVQTQWWPWRERVAPKYKAKKLYEDLFLMYQRQLHLGETYEVVIGLGLLSWRPSEAVEIQRHLVTVNLSLELNPMGQIISLEPTASGIELRLEEDILEPTQRPPAHIRDRVKNGLREISTQALTSNTVHELLREYVHALSPEARYDESFALPKDLSHTPLVTFSPCLILRKRGGEGILGMVEAIIQHIERGGDIPPAVLRQVSIIEEVEEAETSSQDRLLCDDDGNETYFPLPANREQQDVLRHLSKAHGTVLEGPPGTGKSLTIANLICHLLATGKRVLVTSHTARALQVVRGWIPDPIKPLCVQALSNDAAGMQELEFSVKGITDRYLKYKHEDSRHEVERLTKELHNAREKLQQALKEQRSIREKEVHRHDKIAGVYSGTAAEIARLLKSEEDEVGFIKDDINLDQNAPCSAEDFRSLLSSLVSYTDPVGCGGGGEFPDLNDIPKPHEYEALIVELGRLEKQAELHSEDTHVFTEKLRGLPLDQRKSLASQIRAMANDVEALRARRTESWFDRAFYDIFTEKDRIWRGRLRDLQESVKKLRAIPRDDVLAQVTGLESIDPNELQRRVKVLQDFLAERKTDRFGIRWLLPKNVRAALDFISGVHIDGEPCSERRLLDRLWNHAEALCLLAKLDREWASLEKCNEESLARKIDWYEDVWERLAEILNLYEKAKEVWRVCAECGDRGPAWQDETDVLEYLNALERVEVFDRFKDKQAEVRALVTLIERKVEKFPDLQCLKNLKEAMTQRHKDQYREAWVQLNRTREQLECRARAGATLDTLSRVAPSLVEELRRDPSSPRWDDLVRNWDRAWAWARARTWLAHLT